MPFGVVNRARRFIPRVMLSAALPALLLLLAARAAGAEDAEPGYHSETWTTERGLPGDTVRAVTQTRDGYLWVATQAGLARFDGVRFQVFSKQNEPAFRSNECNVLLEGGDGSLWVGTVGGGLLRYKGGRFTSYGRAEGLPTDVVNGLYEDRAGRLWVTSYEALTVFEAGRFKTFPTADAARYVYAVPFHEDDAGRVWLFHARGFNYGNVGTLLFYEDGELHSGEEAARLFPYKPLAGGGGFSAFAGRGGAFWVNDHAARTFRRVDGSVSAPVEYGQDGSPALAHEDAEGNLWVATTAYELRVVSGGRARRVSATGMPRGAVNALYTDREGNLWVGSSSGLSRLRRQAFKAYTTAEGLSNETVWAVFEDARGDVWFGTNGGVDRLRDGRFEYFGRRDGFAADGAVSVAEDAEGRLWFASTLGLTSYKDGRAQTYERGDGLLSENVRGVLVDSKGRLWAGTLGGLNLFEGGRFKSFTTDQGLPHNNVLLVHEDRAGRVWVGTPAGLARLREDGRFEVFRKADGLGSDIVIAAHDASDGSLWFGTVGGGLARYKNEKFEAVTASAGLGDDTVTRILEDGAGRLWMGSTRGVLRASLKELNAVADGAARAFTCVAYGKADGLPTNDCSGGTQPAGWRARDGRLWFPTSKGVAVVDPSRLGRNDVAPPVVIESLVVDREERALADGLILQAGSRAVEFHFTALSFVDPARVRFRYKLEGFDGDWVDAGARREAFYTNLPPGAYRFRVSAANEDGVWNEGGAEVRFRLRPYFYQTVWFYALCAVLLGALMWGVHRLRVRQLRREFTVVLAERNRIARELHDTLAQGFTGVSMQLEAVSAKLGREEAREHLNRARLLVRSSLAEARRSVRDLRSELLDGASLGEALGVVARQLTDGSDVRAEVSTAGVVRRLPERVERNLFRVGQEALTNAVRHAGATRVRVRVDYGDEGVRLEVSDDGRGFPPPAPGRAGGGGDSGGFGLRGMRERVAQLGGELHIDSRPGAGTQVTAAVPFRDSSRES